MYGKKKASVAPAVEEKKEKSTPAYLRDDYPYKAIGELITDLDSLVQTGVLYEIKCAKCEMSIRSQECNIKGIYERLMNEIGCIGCRNKELIIREVDMSRMTEVETANKAKTDVEKNNSNTVIEGRKNGTDKQTRK